MKPFRFCPACGARVTSPDRDGARHCTSCGRAWYQNPAPTAGGAIVENGRALVAVRAKDPQKGRLDVPGGFVQIGEHPVDALKRELREELGVEIDAGVEDCLQMAPHLYGDESDHLLSLGFRARLVGGTPKPMDDVAEIVWVAASDVDDLDFAWEHDRALVRKVLRDG